MDNTTNASNSTTQSPPPQSSDEKLVAGLEDILKKQLRLMRTSRDKAAFDLAGQTTDFVNIIGQKEILKDDKFVTQRQNIQRLYKELTLATAERKLLVSSELKKIRKGKKSVGAYKNEIMPTHSNLL
ncbi:MAG: hypothetical protein FVQ82_01175 [Planctomycetes bacterium]|nr:hypothetical protein [Planctomycetota bacterium]